MKKLLLFFFILAVVKVYSADFSGLEYKNLNINLNTHETRLASSEDIVPVYTEVKYSFMKENRINPFLKGKLGFSYVDDMEENNKMRDMASNGYYSMGTGVDIGYLSMEAAYATYQVGYADTDDTTENRVILKVMYRY